MNERIKELAKQQAGSILMDLVMPDAGKPERVEWNVGITSEHLEKFAELIVAEMLQTCEEHPAWTGRMIGEEIKEHFGVEE